MNKAVKVTPKSLSPNIGSIKNDIKKMESFKNINKHNNSKASSKKGRVVMVPVFATAEQEKAFARSAKKSMRKRRRLTMNFINETAG